MITTAANLKAGDTFKNNLIGSQWLTVRGFRAYRNKRHPELECEGMTRVADVTTERGRTYGITVFPETSIVIKAAHDE